MNDLLLKRVLYGISCRNYEAAAEAIPGAIGLSSSTVSRGFVQASAAKLREMQERDLTGEDVVALFLDGKTFAEATMVVALGITLCGEKRFLGFVETDTENGQVLTPFLRSLLERGLDISQGLLVIIDGGKGLQAAVKKAFRKRALIQRCQWHKRENVVSYLSKGEQASWRKRLQWAYNRPEYEEALTALEQLHGELEERNQSAAGSLEEGLEETLTLHRLGVHAVLGYYDYVQAEHKARAEASFPESADLRTRLGVAMHTKLDILKGDRGLLAALFRYGGDPDHPLSWFGEATQHQRELSEAVFETALGNERFPEDIRRIAPRLLWTLHMGIVLYFVFDRSPGQEKTRRLTDGALDLVVQSKRIVTNPLLRPLREKVIVLLEDAGLLPRLAPQERT